MPEHIKTDNMFTNITSGNHMGTSHFYCIRHSHDSHLSLYLLTFNCVYVSHGIITLSSTNKYMCNKMHICVYEGKGYTLCSYMTVPHICVWAFFVTAVTLCNIIDLVTYIELLHLHQLFLTIQLVCLLWAFIYSRVQYSPLPSWYNKYHTVPY